MRLTTMAAIHGALVVSVPLLPSPAQSTRTATIVATIEDADAGEPLSHVKAMVQLFPREREGRAGSLCVPSDDGQPFFSSDVTRDADGSFRLTVPAGDSVAKITVAKREPVFGCLHIDTAQSVRSCGADPLRVFPQYLFIRTINSIPGFSGDILSTSACAAFAPSLCSPLMVPNLVRTNEVLLLDLNGDPIRNAQLKFHEYTKTQGKLVGILRTDSNGTVGVSSQLGAGGLLRMAVESERASGEFLIQFARVRTPGQQTIKLFNWRCRGDVLQGAIVRP